MIEGKYYATAPKKLAACIMNGGNVEQADKDFLLRRRTSLRANMYRR